MSGTAPDRVRALITELAGRRSDWRLHRPSTPRLPSSGPHLIGAAMVVVSVLVGWVAFSGTQGYSGAGFALFIGSVSIMLMAWSNLLSTRVSALEQLFGGLDRMYRWHRWCGVLAVAAMWLHTQTADDDIKGIPGASKDVAEAATDLASTGTNMIYVLVGVSLLRWLPYRWWRLGHKLLGIPFAFACWHFYTAMKPFHNDSFWGRWFTGFMLLGIAGWLYRVVWRDMVRRGHDHRILNIERTGDTTVLNLEPIDRRLKHEAGQFAFVKARSSNLSEPHPFTIASAPDSPTLKFVIRDLGDWSARVGTHLSVGDRVTVEGPYGRLEPLPDDPERPVLWIAGGVGITPFLGVIEAATRSQTNIPRLIFCARSRTDAPGLPDIELAAEEGRIDLHLFISDEQCRLDSDALSRIVGDIASRDPHIVMCGPTGLVRQCRSILSHHGLTRIHVEEFDIRTGIGPDLSRQVDRILSRWVPSLDAKSVAASAESDSPEPVTSHIDR